MPPSSLSPISSRLTPHFESTERSLLLLLQTHNENHDGDNVNIDYFHEREKQGKEEDGNEEEGNDGGLERICQESVRMRRRRVKRSVVFSLPSSSSSATVSLAHTDDRDLGGDSNHDAAFNISNVHSHIGFNDANAAFKEPEPTIPNSKNNRISSQPLHVYDTIEVTARRMIQDHNDPILPPESFSFLQGGRRASSSSIMSMRTKREEEAEKPASKMGKGKEKERSPHGCEDSYFSFPPFLLLPEDSSYDSDSNSDESREESFFRDGGTTTDMDMDIDTATLETTHKCCCCEGSRLIDDRDRGSKKGKQKQGEGRCCVCVIF